jgi:hypothetical protein
MTAIQASVMLMVTNLNENEKEHETMNTSATTAMIESDYTSRKLGLASQVGRFLLHFLEMQIPMGLGMAVFAVLIRQLRASSYAVAFQSGSDLSILLDGLLMTAPMLAWMVFRGHGWRHSLEMGAAMITPGIVIILLGWLGVGAYLPWLAKAACGVMCLGMLVYMVFRFDHFTGQAGHSGHAAHSAGATGPECHTA